MLSRLRNSARFRMKWAEIGVWSVRPSAFDVSRIKVAGHRIDLMFPHGEELQHQHELGLIHFEDCYALESLHEPPRTVVDVGGNVGLFAIVARHKFPSAAIHCYEPNPALKDMLAHNLGDLDVSIHCEAVGLEAGHVRIEQSGGTLHSVAKKSAAGVPMVSLRTAVDRCGGSVDLLKLDCEGAEWEMIEKSEALDAVQTLTMEYHLWAKPGSTVEELISSLRSRGLRTVHVQSTPGKAWGLLFATR